MTNVYIKDDVYAKYLKEELDPKDAKKRIQEVVAEHAPEEE